jgi:hypothetical protein
VLRIKAFYGPKVRKNKVACLNWDGFLITVTKTAKFVQVWAIGVFLVTPLSPKTPDLLPNLLGDQMDLGN